MSCPRTREIGRTLTPRELRAFCEHARSCADCGVLLDRLEHSYRVLRSEKILPLSPTRRVGLLARIEARELKPRFVWRFSRAVMSIGLLAMVVAMFVAFWAAERTPRSAPAPVPAPAPIARETAPSNESIVEAAPRTPLELLAWELSLSPLDPQRVESEITPLWSPPSSAVLPPERRVVATARKIDPVEPVEPVERVEPVEPELEPVVVAEETPVPKINIEELLARADELRRAGEKRAAAEIYLKVAVHAEGEQYAEEALLRTAQLYADEQAADEALATLRAASERFPRGMFAPERAVLEAKLHLAQQQPERAADALERIGDRNTLAIARARLEVAEVLLTSSPERARRLVAPLLESKVSAELQKRAQMIDRSSRGNR